MLPSGRSFLGTMGPISGPRSPYAWLRVGLTLTALVRLPNVSMVFL
jgi:hypothetical protein